MNVAVQVSVSVPPWSATAGEAQPVECDRRDAIIERRHHMPEAVIVDAVRTPIGRAVKGSLKDVRADDLAAIPLKALHGAQPRGRLRRDRRRHHGRRLRRRRAGLQHRPQRLAARGHHHHVPGVHASTASAPRRCRRSAWPSTRSRRARATSTSPPASRPSRAPRGRADFEFHQQLDGSEGSLFNVYIPMGLTAENVAERCSVTPRGAGRVGRDLAAARRRRPGVRPLRHARSSVAVDARHRRARRVPRRRHQGRRPARRHDRWRSSPS